ncbi:unnamed protein product, partial [Effrenium voratum]
ICSASTRRRTCIGQRQRAPSLMWAWPAMGRTPGSRASSSMRASGRAATIGSTAEATGACRAQTRCPPWCGRWSLRRWPGLRCWSRSSWPAAPAGWWPCPLE